MEKKMVSKVLSGVLVGGMLLTGSMAYAADRDQPATKNIFKKMSGVMKAGAPREVTGKAGYSMKGMGQGGLHFKVKGPGISQEMLDQLVKDNALSQEKADEIRAFIDKRMSEIQAQREEFKNLTPEERKALFEKRKAENSDGLTRERKDLFTELIDNKILTQEQADTITVKLREAAQQQKQQRLVSSLNGLIEKGTITQAQVDAILAKCVEMKREDNVKKKQSPIDQLVEEGTITEEQAKVIGQALPYKKGFKSKGVRF